MARVVCGCVSAAARGREEKKKKAEPVFPKPSSYIANAWSNMASFIMDQLLASACKVYHVHCKEVKDWLLFASNVAAHALALLQGGVAAARGGGVGLTSGGVIRKGAFVYDAVSQLYRRAMK